MTETEAKRYTVRELKKIAKDRKVKLKSNGNIEHIRSVLGMEPIDIPKKYHHCRVSKIAQPIVLTNIDTGEETKHKSI